MFDINRKRRIPNIIVSCDDLTAPDGHFYTQDEIDVKAISNPDGSMASINWNVQRQNPLMENVWQSIRTTGIGGSEVGILFGDSHWQNPLDLYHSKIGTIPQTIKETDSSRQYMFDFGHAMEEFVAKQFVKLFVEKYKSNFETRFSEAYGKIVNIVNCEVVRDTNMYRCPEYPWLIADFDFLVRFTLDDEKVLEGIFECKTSSPYQISSKWENGFPESYKDQVHNYMVVGDYDFYVIACCSDNNISHYYAHLGFKEDNLVECLISVTADFWNNCVQQKREPFVSDINLQDTLLMYQRPTKDEEINLTRSRVAIKALDSFLSCKEKVDELNKEATELKKECDLHKSKIARILGPYKQGSLWNENRKEFQINVKTSQRYSLDAKARDKLFKEHPELKAVVSSYMTETESVSYNIEEKKVVVNKKKKTTA